MAFVPLSNVIPQLFDDNGELLSGGKIKFYDAGTTTPTTVYSDSAGTALGTEVDLDADGHPRTAGGAKTLIWLETGQNYKIEAVDASGVNVWGPFDNIPPFATSTTTGNAPDEWAKQTSVIYNSATSFIVPGDPEDEFGNKIWHVGRRVAVSGSSTGEVFGTISAVSIGTDTTITLAAITDSTGATATLSSEALTAWVGIAAAGYATALPIGAGVYYAPAYGVATDGTISKDAMSTLIDAVPEYSTIYLPDGDYDLSGLQIEKNGIRILGQSKEGVRITVSADATSGIFFRCGKRGPDTDYRDDNLPVYDGTIEHFDADEYSPAVTDYPRYKDIRVDNVTIVVSDAGGVGVNTGFDFYRVDGGGFDIKLEWSSQFEFGNGIRVQFCSNLDCPYVQTDDNPNVTFNFLHYWTWGTRGGLWDIGTGDELSMEFKHGVNVHINDLRITGNSLSSYALDIGYGSRQITFDKCTVNDSGFRIKASEEFDESSGIRIHDLRMDNPTGSGVTFVHVTDVQIDRYRIRAERPLLSSFQSFYMFSDDTVIVPALNSDQLEFDGNYDTSLLSGDITKYFEVRPNPVLANSSFGVGELIVVGTNSEPILANVSGGIGAAFDGSNKLRRISSVSDRGFEESKRTTVTYHDDIPYAFRNVDFGDMRVSFEDAGPTGGYAFKFSSPLYQCRGRLSSLNGDAAFFQALFIVQSDIGLYPANPPAETTEYVATMNTLSESRLYGTWPCKGLAALMNGVGVFYADGYDNAVFEVDLVYDAAPATATPFRTDLDTPSTQWHTPIRFVNCTIRRTDGVSLLSTVHRIIQHDGTTPTGVDTNGGGYVSSGCYVDGNLPFHRYFTSANAADAPGYTPNTIGELAQNGTTGTWWIAKSLTAWSAL